MNKKFYALLLAAGLFVLPLSACGARGGETENGGGMSENTPPAESNEIAPELPPETEKDPPMPEIKACASYICVQVDGLNVRTGAGTVHAALGQVQKGELLALCEEAGAWRKTQYQNQTAFVSADPKYTTLVSLEKGSDEVEQVVCEGLKLLGTPYVYGATRLHDGKGGLIKGFSAARFDCSSLMQYIFYFGAGVLLDMNTRTQIAQGVHVEWKDLERGDLLFFTNASRCNKTGIERVGHVALYLGGNYILHTASDYAKIEEISAARRAYFLEARRVL